MPKKINPENLIEKEIGHFQDKLQEFQRYLKDKDISGVASFTDSEFTSDDQDKHHKEIIIQIKMQDAILAWLPLLKKLREVEKEKMVETRGDVEVGDHFKKG